MAAVESRLRPRCRHNRAGARTREDGFARLIDVPDSSESAKYRRRLVRDLERRGLIRSDHVRDVFLAVPREIFLAEFAAREGLDAVYRDEAIPTKFDADGFPISSSSQPAIMAEMLEQLALEPGMRVLEIGAGTGYNAALLAEIVGRSGRVTAIEVDAEIARGARAALRKGGYRAQVVVRDGRDGFPERAPYDRIIVTASSDTVPPAWFEQIVEQGLIEVPLRLSASGAQVIPTLRKTASRLITAAVVGGGFMPLRSADCSNSVPTRPPCLIATDATSAGRNPPLRQIAGGVLASLSPAAKRRLLSIALNEGRRRRLGLRAHAESLALYLTLTLPAARAVSVFPGLTIGLISRDGNSLAYVESRAHLGQRWITALTAHGDRRAENELARSIRGWDEKGRPGPAQLHIQVEYRDGADRIHKGWR
jgi:protein-L-isoaspartate(D-aspartate) O-methyltransferase